MNTPLIGCEHLTSLLLSYEGAVSVLTCSLYTSAVTKSHC